jgi:cobaltochelatase CobN
MTEGLLEAYQRGMWNAKDESIQRLYVEIEGEIEEHI